ncbi:hypothetical protein [Microbispora sp. H10830]|uniref:hypothetical protein n=1 Tax=Microbispora sp. H10830 TaxID=2729109 RepID=UPI0015FF4802|nr:hypothetical protein [Microbispora sp. H10830]
MRALTHLILPMVVVSAMTSGCGAFADGVRITYTSAGRQRTVDFSLRVLLCAPGDTERCREAYEERSTTSDDD